ncbi:MAG: FN3 associated domain-containing protein [Victivallales bacterium]
MKNLVILICLLLVQQCLFSQQVLRYEMNPTATVSYTQDWLNSTKLTLSADASLTFRWIDGYWTSGNYGTNHNLYLYKNGVPYMWILDNGAVENTILGSAGDQFGLWIGGSAPVSGSATYEVTVTSLDVPTISPPGGIVRPDTLICILPPEGFPGSQIFYTTDGSIPTSSSMPYLYPFMISGGMTVRAIACYGGLKSAVNTRTFQIGWAPPEIFPPSAGFQVGDEVEVTVTNSPNNNGEGAILFRYSYGSGQTSWTEYVNPIIVTETSTIEAKVAGTDGESDVVSATYEFILENVATPVITPTGGAFTELPAVEISCATQGATIYYTTNGTEPSKTSSVYSGPITLTGSSRVKAFAAKVNMGDSDKVSRAYVLDDPLPQGDGTNDAYNDYLDTRNGLWYQYETLQDDGVLDDIIDLDDEWANGGVDTGAGGADGGDTGGGTDNGDGSGDAGGNTDDSGSDTGGTSGGTSTSTTNEGDSNYYSSSNTYNSYDNSSGNTDYLSLGAIGAIGVLPFIMKQETHPSVNGGSASDEERNENDSWSKRINFTK